MKDNNTTGFGHKLCKPENKKRNLGDAERKQRHSVNIEF